MEKEKTPTCVGFIMDGNRRWARARGLGTLEGHKKGYEAMQEIIDAVYRAHIPHMVCYAFSTENWNRDEEEVNYLMGLSYTAVTELQEKSRTDDRKVNFRIVGQKDRLSEKLQHAIAELESNYFEKPELTVWVALSYGGRAEIIEAVNRCVENGEAVDEKIFESELWTAGMPDPDLIIRTSGECRLSNFLLWQAAYSELFFTDTLWPDFGEVEFQSILEEYANRQRRKGT